MLIHLVRGWAAIPSPKSHTAPVYGIKAAYEEGGVWAVRAGADFPNDPDSWSSDIYGPGAPSYSFALKNKYK